MNLYTMPLETMNIYKYCNTTSKTVRGGLNPYNSPCAMRMILPLSKTNKIPTSTNNTSETKNMQYSRWINTYGTTQNSGSAVKSNQLKTCLSGINRFTY